MPGELSFAESSLRHGGPGFLLTAHQSAFSTRGGMVYYVP